MTRQPKFKRQANFRDSRVLFTRIEEPLHKKVTRAAKAAGLSRAMWLSQVIERALDNPIAQR